MKNINRILLVSIFCIFGSALHAQIKTGTNDGQTISSENAFLDASSFGDFANNEGKGLVFPRTDLTLWTFKVDLLDGFSTFPTAFDGMIVFNTGTGVTLTGTNNPNASSNVVPGFYYFYNPNGTDSVTTGRWLPIGSPANNVVKSKTITAIVPANPTAATLNLAPAGVLASGEVVTFLGAKIYDSTGANLIMTADSAYDKVNNVLTTGNGMMYQVLAQGTYKVVLDYK